MKYDWIFFDLDNTLMDFSRTARKAFSETMKSYGVREEQGHHEMYEIVNKDAWKLFEENEITALQLRKKRFNDFFSVARLKGIDPLEFHYTYSEFIIEHSFMMEDAITLLDTLKGKINKAIITNGLKETQRPRMTRLDINHYFTEIVVSDEIGVSKPHAAFFDHVVESCGHPSKEQILVVGDSLNSDIRGGNNYGLATCWFNSNQSNNLTTIQPTFEVHSLEDILGILD